MRLENWSHFYEGRKLLGASEFTCQVKPKWASGSLKNKIGCQKIFTGVWTGLCGYFLSDHKDDICESLCY